MQGLSESSVALVSPEHILSCNILGISVREGARHKKQIYLGEAQLAPYLPQGKL